MENPIEINWKEQLTSNELDNVVHILEISKKEAEIKEEYLQAAKLRDRIEEVKRNNHL